MTKPNASSAPRKKTAFTTTAGNVNGVVIFLAIATSLVVAPTYCQLFSSPTVPAGSLAASSTPGALTGPGFFPRASQAAFSLPKWQQDLVYPTCTFLDAKKALERCVVEGTSQTIKDDVIELILKTMNADKSVSHYISFVLAYLENFKIVIKSSVDYSIDFPDRLSIDWFDGSHYSPRYRHLNLYIPEGLEYIKFSCIIRHEFRHAYWHAYNIYSSSEHLLFNCQNIHPVTIEMKQQYLRYIVKGHKRIRDLENMLQHEKKNKLKAEGKDTLKAVRALFGDINCELYPSERRFDSSHSLVVGKSYTFLIRGFEARAKILNKRQLPSGGYTATMLFEDPAMYIIAQAEKVFDFLDFYKETLYCAQFDAILHQLFPKKLAMQYFPEIEAYNIELENRVMQRPSPNAMNDPSSHFLTKKEEYAHYLSTALKNASNSEGYFLSFFETEDDVIDMMSKVGRILLFYREKVYRGVRITGNALAQVQEIKSVLKLQIKHKKHPHEAHRLLAKAYHIEKRSDDNSDAQKICLHYKVAFNNRKTEKPSEQRLKDLEKDSVIFDEYDFIDYSDALLAIEDIGQAKIVVQKGCQAFPQSVALKIQKGKIKDLQQGGGERPQLRP